MRAAVLYGPEQVTIEDLPQPTVGDTEVLLLSAKK